MKRILEVLLILVAILAHTVALADVKTQTSLSSYGIKLDKSSITLFYQKSKPESCTLNAVVSLPPGESTLFNNADYKWTSSNTKVVTCETYL